jgi:hypothetical protein
MWQPLCRLTNDGALQFLDQEGQRVDSSIWGKDDLPSAPSKLKQDRVTISVSSIWECYTSLDKLRDDILDRMSEDTETDDCKLLQSSWRSCYGFDASGPHAMPFAGPPEFLVCPPMRQVRVFRHFWPFRRETDTNKTAFDGVVEIIDRQTYVALARSDAHFSVELAVPTETLSLPGHLRGRVRSRIGGRRTICSKLHAKDLSRDGGTEG